MKKGILTNARLNRLIDILKNFDLYEKLVEGIDTDLKKHQQKEKLPAVK